MYGFLEQGERRGSFLAALDFEVADSDLVQSTTPEFGFFASPSDLLDQDDPIKKRHRFLTQEELRAQSISVIDDVFASL